MKLLIINTELLPIKSIYLINNNSSQDPLQHSWWLLLHLSTQTISTGILLLTSRQTAMLKTGCLLKCNAFIQYSELLTSDRASPGQLQGPSMPDSTVASSRCNKELETLCASPTYPSGSSPTTKIVNEHELIH